MTKTWKLESVERDNDGTFTLELTDSADGIAFAVVDASFYNDPPYFGVDQVKLFSTMGWTTQKPSEMDIQTWLTASMDEVKDAILKEYERDCGNMRRICGSWS